MRLMPIDVIVNGMVLGRPIYDDNNRIILNAGVQLTNGLLKKLINIGYTKLYIEDSDTFGIEIQEIIPETVKRKKIKEIKDIYSDLANTSTNSKLTPYRGIGVKFENIFKELFGHLQNNKDLVISMSDIYTADSYLFTHSINVGVYAIIMAILDNKRYEYTKEIGIGAMLHDVGKLKIDKKLLDNPNKLTEAEMQEVNEHCKYGFDIIKKQGLSAVSAHCALQHHEKFDGTGYPRNLKGKDGINEVGRILAVVDVFDSLTSNKAYRNAYLPNESLEYLFAHSGSHFDPYYVMMFSKHVNIYPIGMPVVLSNGDVGVISRINSHNLQRPVILVLEHENKKVSPYELNLEDHLNVTIVECNLNVHKVPTQKPSL